MLIKEAHKMLNIRFIVLFSFFVVFSTPYLFIKGALYSQDTHRKAIGIG